MVQINFAQKSVTVKIVYYGPGMSGKTTNLEIVHQRAPDSSRGDLTSISTDGDRTLFFDFMPLDLGTVAGMRTQFQIYTVPGQVYYNSTRKLVLQGVDGVIFVADSSANMMEENLESLRNLEENLAEYGKDISEMPLIIQYNKRDLPDALPVAELEAKLNPWGCPSFEAVANSGQGVFPTLKALAARVLESIHDRTGAPTKPGPGSQAPAQTPAPPSAPAPMSAPSAGGPASPQAAPAMPSAESHNPSASPSNAGQTPPAPFPTPNSPQAQPSSPFSAPAPQASMPPPPFPSPPQQAPAPVPAPVNSASAEASSTPPNPFPAPSAPNMHAPQGGQGHHAPQHPAAQPQAPSNPEPQAPRTAAGPPTGGLTMGAPLPPQGLSLSQPQAPQAPQAPQSQGATGSFAPPQAPQAPGLGQTGIQPMYQPSSPSTPQGGPGATHPSLSQTGIRPMPGYGAPGAQAGQPGQAGHPFPPVGAAPGAPGNPNAAARPVPQSTRLKPRSQTVTITPADNKSGKGKWVFFTLLLLSAAGAGAAYFLELI